MLKESNPKLKGQYFEKLAIKFLKTKDYKILKQNVQESHKEIDIICIKNNVIHFVEVKGRISNIEAITETLSYNKRKNLIEAAKMWIIKKYNTDEVPWIIDFIGIQLDNKGKYNIHYFENEINELYTSV